MKQRLNGPDIIRVLAILFVMATHAIAYLTPMGTAIHSLKWTVYVVIRFTSLSCVPLFIMLTGYLNRKKTLTAAYFRGIIPVLISYAVISVFCILYAVYKGNTSYDVFSSIRSILSFSANGYAWYVEMYIGLFLLIPFLNLLFDRLQTFRARLLLCTILVLLTMLPTTLESFRVNGAALNILPDYWKSAYPITYYYIGAMIAEYRPRVKKIYAVLLTALAIAVPSALCWFFSSVENGYAWYMMNGFACITSGAVALTVFLLFYDVELPRPFGVVFREISVCTFEMYLLSDIIDRIVYKGQRYFMPAMVLTVFVLSYLCARVLRLLLVPLYKKIKSSREKCA